MVIVLWIYIYYFYIYFYNSGSVKKKQIMQFANKKIYYKPISGKNLIIKKKRLKASVLLENNQPTMLCRAKRKKPCESYQSWYEKVLNILSRAKLE